MEACPIHRVPPDGFTLSEVEVRLVRPQERVRWDALMEQHHYLGFRRLAGRGPRYVAMFRGQWLGLAAWQNGAFKCRPRDRRVGWKPAQQFQRLEWIANNPRLLVLSEPGTLANFASWFLGQMTRRLADDWRAAHGHRVLLAETFCDPARFSGTVYRAAGWERLGQTRGYARANGRYTDPHGQRKEIFVTALRRDARKQLSRTQSLSVDVAPSTGLGAVPRDVVMMRSMYRERAAVADFRRAQGKQHTVAGVLTVHLLAERANMKGCLAAAQYAQSLSQTELEAVGAWQNPRTGRFEPVSKSTLHRVIQSLNPEALEDGVSRHARPRLPLRTVELRRPGRRTRGHARPAGAQ